MATESYYKSILENDLETGKIHQNQNGKYKKSFFLGYDPKTGKEIRITAVADTITELAFKLAKKHTEYENGTKKPICKKTFKEVALEWYDVCVKNGKTCKGNKKNYKMDIENHIIPKLGEYRITALKQKDYQQFLNSYAESGESLVKKLKMTLLRIIKYADQNEYITSRNITLEIPQVTRINSRRILTEDEIKLLIKAQQSYTPAYVFLLLLIVGMRPSEACRLKWSDIDEESKIIRVNVSKTENGIRIIPIPECGMKIISDEKGRLQKQGIKTEYVFHQLINPKKPHNTESLRKCWLTTIHRMDILNGATVYRNEIIKSTFDDTSPLVPYCLRHTYCTMLVNSGVSEYIIKRLMGHTLKDSITFGVYTHSSDSEIIKGSQSYLDYINNLFDKCYREIFREMQDRKEQKNKQ